MYTGKQKLSHNVEILKVYIIEQAWWIINAIHVEVRSSSWNTCIWGWLENCTLVVLEWHKATLDVQISPMNVTWQHFNLFVVEVVKVRFPPFLWPLPYWSMVSWGFVPNNFHGGRMYRTGDMVRFMPLQPWGQLSVDRLPQAARRILGCFVPLNRHWMYAILIRSCKI